MKVTAICAILSIAFTGASAWKPEKPEKPDINIQKPQYSVCGNDVTAYCCNNESFYGGKVDCTAHCKFSVSCVFCESRAVTNALVSPKQRLRHHYCLLQRPGRKLNFFLPL